jgi:hypothetical protein
VRLDYLYFNVIICRESAVAGCTGHGCVRLDYLYFIVIICRKSAVAGCTGHGREAGLSGLHCDICRKSAVAGCTGHGCEAGLSVLHCDICRKSAVAGCTGHGCEAGPTVSRTIEEKTGQDKKSQEKHVGYKMRFVTSYDLNMWIERLNH